MNYLLVSEGPITFSFLYMSRTSPAEILNTCLINSYTISKYFFNCEKCIVLDKSRYRCMFNVIHKPRKIEILT